MVRRLALALIALAAFARSAEAQFPTWCSDPTQGACFTVTAFEYRQVIDATGPETWYDSYVSLSGYWTGAILHSSETINGFPTLWTFSMDLAALGLLGQTSLHFGETATFLGEVGTATFRANVRQQLLKIPELTDIVGISTRTTGWCGVDGRMPGKPACSTVNVPEPSSLLLLASGLLGLGFVARRRREEV